jgi:hypothetical protein
MIHSWKLLNNYKHDGAKKQLATINESSLQNNWAELLDNPTTTQLVESNRTGETNQQHVIS